MAIFALLERYSNACSGPCGACSNSGPTMCVLCSQSTGSFLGSTDEGTASVFSLASGAVVKVSGSYSFPMRLSVGYALLFKRRWGRSSGISFVFSLPAWAAFFLC